MSSDVPTLIEAFSLDARFKIAWRAFFGGDIGPIGWCGQMGYWWTRPCGHEPGGCGWFDGQRVQRRVEDQL